MCMYMSQGSKCFPFVLDKYMYIVDFLAEQVTFHWHCLIGKSKLSVNWIKRSTSLRLAHGKKKFESCLFKGQAGIQFFPAYA